GNRAQLPRSCNAATHRIALAKLTPNRRAAARQLMPSSRTAQTTRLRKSTDKGPIPRRLRFGAPQESHFQCVGNTPIQPGRKPLAGSDLVLGVCRLQKLNDHEPISVVADS